MPVWMFFASFFNWSPDDGDGVSCLSAVSADDNENIESLRWESEEIFVNESNQFELKMKRKLSNSSSVQNTMKTHLFK